MATISIDLLGLESLNQDIIGFLLTEKSVKRMQMAGLDEFFKIEEEIFKEEGGSRAWWAPLSDKYLTEKINSGYGNLPLMQRTGTLKNTLTGKDKSKLNIVDEGDRISLYIDSPYWRRHQFGLDMPQRQTVVLTKDDEDRILKVMVEATFAGKLSRFLSRS
jgi:hypothetical protein